MIHTTFVVGHVGKIESINTEDPFVKMRVAVDDYGNTVWYTAVGFDHVYRNAITTVKKGTVVVIQGRMQERVQIINGEKRYFNDLVIDQLRCVGDAPNEVPEEVSYNKPTLAASGGMTFKF